MRRPAGTSGTFSRSRLLLELYLQHIYSHQTPLRSQMRTMQRNCRSKVLPHQMKISSSACQMYCAVIFLIISPLFCCAARGDLKFVPCCASRADCCGARVKRKISFLNKKRNQTSVFTLSTIGPLFLDVVFIRNSN